MMDLSILLPTKGRPSSVTRLFESLIQTTSYINTVEVILYVDEDDVTSHGLCSPSLNIIELIRSSGNSMGRMIRECYNASHGRYIMLMNDDAIFRTKGWDLSVIRAFSRFPDDIAFVYGNDLDQGQRVPTFPIVSRRAYEFIGEAFPEGYLNLHIESHLFDIFHQLKQLGHDRIVYLKDVIFEHKHHSLGKSNDDRTYVKTNPLADDRLYIASVEERRYAARKLAQVIQHRKNGSIDVAAHAKEAAHDRKGPIASVVIPVSYNKSEGALPRLDAIAKGMDKETSAEMIVGISGISADASPFSFPNLKRKARIIQKRERVSFARMSNQAAQEARGEFLIFLSASAIPGPGWVDALLNVAQANNRVAVVGCKHLDPRNGRILHAGISFYHVGEEPRMTYLYRGVSSDRPFVNRVREFQAVRSGCMLVKREAFLEVGGFDETIEGMEDIDLCLRMYKQGMKVVYTPEALITYHAHSPYSQAESDSRAFSLLMSRWKGEIRSDLHQFLKEDGLSLKVSENRFIVGLTEE